MADIEEIERNPAHGRPESLSPLKEEARIEKLEPALSTLHWGKLTHLHHDGVTPHVCLLHVFGGSGVQLFNDYFIYDAGQVPGARFGHTATVVSNKIYLFGGHGTNSKPCSDLYVMELDNFSWTKYAYDKTWPESRAGHTLTYVPEKSLMVGFGGHNNKQKYYNGVFILEKVTGDKAVVWRIPKVNGAPPSPRSSHSATAVGNRLFVFGGFDGRRYYNDLHILDLDDFTWRSPVVKGKIPAPRSGHTATYVGTKLFILGGCSSDSTFMNDVHILDAETCTWHYLALKGTVFPPRFKHTSSLLKTGLHVFGGTGSGTLFNDVYVLEKLAEDLFSGPLLAAEKGSDVALGVSANSNMAIVVARQTDSQVEALRQSLQVEKESREKLEMRLASKEGDYLVALETTKRLEGDLAKIEQLLRSEQEKRVKLDRSVKNEKEKRQKASAVKEALEQAVDTQKAALDSFDSRFRALEVSLNNEQMVRIEAEAEISRLKRRDAEAAEAIEKMKRDLEAYRKQAASKGVEDSRPDIAKMSHVELEVYEQEQMRIFMQICKHKSEHAARVEQEVNKLRLEKVVLEEQKVQAQKALQEVRKENELLRDRLDASERSLLKANQHNSLQKQSEKASQEILRRGSLLAHDLSEYSLTELDELEDYCHQSLKRIGTTKQERYSVQIEKLKREKEQLQEQRQCVVCQDRDIRTVLIPCGHQACCRDCAAALKKCPMCRGDIDHIVHTF